MSYKWRKMTLKTSGSILSLSFEKFLEIQKMYNQVRETGGSLGYIKEYWSFALKN